MYANSLNNDMGISNQCFDKDVIIWAIQGPFLSASSSWNLLQIRSPPAVMVEYYLILGVRRDASAEDIKKA